MRPRPVPNAHWRSLTVLLVEDEMLIALDVQEQLEDFGLTVSGPAATVAAALRLIDGHRPDAAVLDVNLRGELVTPVAVRLRGLGVPFVLSSAYESNFLTGELAGAQNLGKPLRPERLWLALNAMLPAEA